MSDYRVIGRWSRCDSQTRRGPLKSVAGLYGLASSGQPPNCHLFLILATDLQSPEAGRKETDAEGGSGIDLPHGR